MKKEFAPTGKAHQNFKFTVDRNDVGRRIDRVLRKILSDAPLSTIYRLLRTGDIKINNHKILPSYRLKTNDKIELPSPPPSPSHSHFIPNLKQNYPGIDSLIIEETEDFIVVNKPRGMLVHGKNSLNTILLGYLNNLRKKPNYPRAFTPGPIHRLDRNTSGIVLFSKTLRGAKQLSKLFREHEIIKIYLAVVEGSIDQETTLKDILHRDRNKKKTEVVTSPGGTKDKEATTYIYPITSQNNLTLTLCIPITGKTHQIRAQLGNYGHPLFGDTKYGGQKNREGFFLHALQLVVKKREILNGLKNFFAPIPEESYIMLESYFGKGCLKRLREKINEIIDTI